MENKTDAEEQDKRSLRRIFFAAGIGIFVYLLAAFFHHNFAMSLYRLVFAVIVFVVLAVAYH